MNLPHPLTLENYVTNYCNSFLYLEEEEAHAVGKMKLALEIHPNALAYSMTTLGAGMMNSIFNFYYVKLFLNRYRISEVAFHQAQVLYDGYVGFHGVFASVIL